MYTLRIVKCTRKDEDLPFDSVIENFELGDAYSIIQKNKTSEFSKIMREEFHSEDPVTIYSILCGSNGKRFFIECFTSLKEYNYFIMTDSVKTFERL